MNLNEAKKVVERYKTKGQDEYKIPIMDVDLDEKLSGAILKLCEEQGEYVMTGYIQSKGDIGIRYYLVYKPDGKRVRFFHEDPIQKCFLSLCRLVNGNIFEVDDNGKLLPYLKISNYNANKDNCKQALDDILIRTYRNKLKGLTDYLLICTFNEERINYYVVV